VQELTTKAIKTDSRHTNVHVAVLKVACGIQYNVQQFW